MIAPYAAVAASSAAEIGFLCWLPELEGVCPAFLAPEFHPNLLHKMVSSKTIFKCPRHTFVTHTVSRADPLSCYYIWSNIYFNEFGWEHWFLFQWAPGCKRVSWLMAHRVLQLFSLVLILPIEPRCGFQSSKCGSSTICQTFGFDYFLLPHGKLPPLLLSSVSLDPVHWLVIPGGFPAGKKCSISDTVQYQSLVCKRQAPIESWQFSPAYLPCQAPPYIVSIALRYWGCCLALLTVDWVQPRSGHRLSVHQPSGIFKPCSRALSRWTSTSLLAFSSWETSLSLHRASSASVLLPFPLFKVTSQTPVFLGVWHPHEPSHYFESPASGTS